MAKKKKAPASVEEALIKRNMNIVGCGGLDVAVFLAIAASRLGHSVLITDKSPEKDVLTAVLQGEMMPVAERHGITVVDGTSEDDLCSEKNYEIHITYYGSNTNEAVLADKTEVQLLVTDMYAQHARLLAKIPPYVKPEEKKKKSAKQEIDKNIESDTEKSTEFEAVPPINIPGVTPAQESVSFGPQIIILNELVKIKYGPKYLLSLAEHKEIKKIFMLNFNTQDFEVKMGIGHEKIFLKDLTEGYKMALNELVAFLIGGYPDKKQLSQIYKR